MDKVVDHLFVFEGNGNISDFPGNYSQYREWKTLQTDKANSEKICIENKPSEKNNRRVERKRKLTFKEKQEMNSLEEEISKLEAQKNMIENSLCSGELSIEELTDLSKKLPQIIDEIDVKSLRWLELSEI